MKRTGLVRPALGGGIRTGVPGPGLDLIGRPRILAVRSADASSRPRMRHAWYAGLPAGRAELAALLTETGHSARLAPALARVSLIRNTPANSKTKIPSPKIEEQER
jgi:hypothetical protein